MEAEVPLGEILTPLGGNVTDGIGARVVASSVEDVALDNVNEGLELVPVDPEEDKELVAVVDDELIDVSC